MEITKLVGKLGPYDQAKLEKVESDAAKAKRSGKSASPGDKVSLSDEAKLRTEAFQEASNTPEVRREKVEAIKAQIAAGEYEIDNRKIAENLVKEDMELLI